MKKTKKQLSKAKIWSIISAGIVTLISLTIIITNVFIPVKYLSSYFVSGNRAKYGIMRITLVDVGYGDCVIVELPDGKNLLIDGGNGRYSNNLKVFKELNKRDIGSIDYLVCSSVNGEHCGGLAEVLKYKSVKTIFMPYCTNKYITDEFCKFTNQTAKSDARIVYSAVGVKERTDKYFFTFLSPRSVAQTSGQYAALNSNPSRTTRNNSSAVLWLEYGDTAILFTSDVEKSILNYIALMDEVSKKDFPVDFEKCKIVQVACHGSDLSESVDFYDFLKAETAVLSVGKNSNGCPSTKVMSDIRPTVGDNLYRTDERGNIVIEITDTNYTIR